MLVMRVIVAAMFVVAMPRSVFPQPKAPSEPLKISVDYARFRGDEQNQYVEIYYALPQWQLTYAQRANATKASIELTTLVLKKDSIVQADKMRVEHSLVDSVGRAHLVHISKMMIPEGQFTLKVIAKDANDTSRTDTVVRNLPIVLCPTMKLALSDIELASSVRKGVQGGLFYKNTFDVVPTPDGMYGETQKCFLYAEVYNLLATEDRSDYTTRTSVLNAVGNEVIGRDKIRKRVGESAVLIDQIDVANLRGGVYTAVLSLLDSTKKVVAATGKKFFVYNSTLGVDSSLMRLDPALSLSIYSTMEEAELDRDFRWSRWEANETEKGQYEKLNGVAAKRKFLTELWSRRPAGLRDMYMKRVAEANSRYQVLGMEGYKTDRGRIHIVYGAPDDIDRHPNESGTKPYEIWSHQQIQGGVIFVFVQRQQGGDYELVHSTHRNELHDENWARYAQTN
jgi:GWxTD domain-containing protein